MQILYIYEITKVGVLNGVKYLHSDLLNNEIESFLFSNKEIDQKNIIYQVNNMLNIDGNFLLTQKKWKQNLIITRSSKIT